MGQEDTVKVGIGNYLSQQASLTMKGAGSLEVANLVHGVDGSDDQVAAVTQSIYVWDDRDVKDTKGHGKLIFNGILMNLVDALETLPLVRASLVRMATAARDGIQLLSYKEGPDIQHEVLEVLAHDLETLAEHVKAQTEPYGIPAEPVATAYTVPVPEEPEGVGPKGSSN
ncbi:hypothetical protein LCGC14_1099220 [marine sediment metagenome]|uniref:Uncharacterized protein n=1 Tax=marine sediment metagenome TaxID=412755 RepID=A0A0F9MEJ8_9ZZZZ